MLVYTPAQVTQTVDEYYYWNPGTSRTQTITLNETPQSGFQVVIGSTKLKSTDYTLNGRTLTLDPTESALYATANLGDSITISYTGAVLHERGEPVYTCTGNTCTEDTYTAGTPVLTLGDEPILYTGGQQAYYATDDPVEVTQAADRLTVTGPSTGTGPMTGDIVYYGLASVTLKLGGQANQPNSVNQVTIDDQHVTAQNSNVAPTTTIDTNGGNDEVAVQAITSATTIQGGLGTNTVYVGSEAGIWPSAGGFTDVKGNANLIDATLTVNGGTDGTDTVTVDDTTDSASNNGVLSSSQLGGIFGTTTAMLDYSGL